MVSELTAPHRRYANLPGVEVVSRIQSRKSPFLQMTLCFYFTRAGRGETPACRLLGDSPLLASGEAAGGGGHQVRDTTSGFLTRTKPCERICQ